MDAKCCQHHQFNNLLHLRPNNELCITHKQRNLKLVLSPPFSPVATVYRNGIYLARIADTVATSECPSCNGHVYGTCF